MERSSSIQSMGGKARSEKLAPHERSEIAREAALARWGASSLLPRETHTGILKIGDMEIPCSVLDNGMRVLSTRGVTRAMGARKTGTPNVADSSDSSGAPQLPPFLASASIRPHIPEDLMVRLISPLQYKPKHGGRTAYGYEATLLPRICEVILDARKNLKSNQRHLASTAETLIRGLARVGIIALIDEATGYQEQRARDELSKILEAYISAELMPWVKRFPDEFFKQIYRLQGWSYRPGSAKRTPYVGKLINKYVYEQLPPGVLEELRRRNPVTAAGYRRYKHFQYLTVDTGNPHLDKQITAATIIMRISDDKRQFEDNFDKAFPSKKSFQRHLALAPASDAEESA